MKTYIHEFDGSKKFLYMTKRVVTYLKRCFELAKACREAHFKHPELFFEVNELGTVFAVFEYPEYGGISKKLGQSLTHAEVSRINEFLTQQTNPKKLNQDRLFEYLVMGEKALASVN